MVFLVKEQSSKQRVPDAQPHAGEVFQLIAIRRVRRSSDDFASAASRTCCSKLAQRREKERRLIDELMSPARPVCDLGKRGFETFGGFPVYRRRSLSVRAIKRFQHQPRIPDSRAHMRTSRRLLIDSPTFHMTSRFAVLITGYPAGDHKADQPFASHSMGRGGFVEIVDVEDQATFGVVNNKIEQVAVFTGLTRSRASGW
jgi:hypothetical protein